MIKTSDSFKLKKNENKDKIINSFPIPRGRILREYIFKHDLLPKNAKIKNVLLKYFEGKDLNRYKIEYI